MKYVSFGASLVLVTCTAAVAWGQYGLYGSPEMLRLPAKQSTAVLPAGYPTTSSPATLTPLASDPAYFPRRLVQTAGTVPAPPVPESSGGGPSMAPPPVAGAPSALNEMRDGSRPGIGGSCSCDPGCSDFESAVGQPPIGDCLPCPSVCQPTVWFGAVGGLIMTRDRANRVWTTYETNNNPNQMMNTEDASVNWQGGWQISFGRWFCCNQWGLEATYWGLGDFDAFASASVAGGSVSTPLIVSDIEFAGINGTQYFDSAREHRLWRRDRFQNLSLNVLYNPTPLMNCCQPNYCAGNPLNVNWLAGVRFFRFDERLVFGSLDLGYNWGDGGGQYEAYLRDSIKNTLVGGQIGANVSYQIAPNLQLLVGPRFGIYNNRIQNDFQAVRGDDVVANPTAASGVTGTYPVRSSKDVVAFMGQLDVALNCQLTQHWGGFLGYRVMAVTGVGLADNQIPTYVVDIPEIANIDTNGDLVLHGAFAGVVCNF